MALRQHTPSSHTLSASGPALQAVQPSEPKGPSSVVALSQLLSLPAHVSSPTWKDVWSPPPPSHRVTYTSERKEVTEASDGMEVRWSSSSDDTDMAGSSSPSHAELAVIQPGQQAKIL